MERVPGGLYRVFLEKRKNHRLRRGDAIELQNVRKAVPSELEKQKGVRPHETIPRISPGNRLLNTKRHFHAVL
jgi:hypothetical protein